MTTDVEIVNNALTKLGESPIEDLNTEEENARRANIVFNLAVDEVVGEGAWSSVIFRDKMEAIGVSQDLRDAYYDYKGFYFLPTDPRFIRMIEVFDYKDDYLVHGDHLILKTDEPCIIEYLGAPSNTGFFNSYLTSSIVDKLAEKLAMMITDKQDLLDRLKADYLINLKANLGRDYLQSSKKITRSRMASSILRSGY